MQYDEGILIVITRLSKDRGSSLFLWLFHSFVRRELLIIQKVVRNVDALVLEHISVKLIMNLHRILVIWIKLQKPLCDVENVDILCLLVACNLLILTEVIIDK